MFFNLFTEAIPAKNLKIAEIIPDKKDWDRVEKLSSEAKVRSMANKIGDSVKLVRRTKAYISAGGEYTSHFTDRMISLGFSDKQVEEILGAKGSIVKAVELPQPATRKGVANPAKSRKARPGSYGAPYTIMNASSVYTGKLSKVIDQQYGDTVILLGIANGRSKVAIVGSASGMKVKENGLDFYKLPNNGYLAHQLDTGNGYRMSSTEIILTDYVLVKKGKAVTAFDDKTYKYYVFK